MAIITQDEVLNYIPQKPPIVMVSELLSNNETQTVSSFQIEPDNMFCQNGLFTEPGLVENIAQTAALRMGHFASLQSGDEDPPVGFIGAVSKLKVHKLPVAGSRLQTTVDVLNDVFGITLIKGISRIDEDVIAECEMKIVIQPS